MFSLSDQRVLSALVKAHKRKVKIRVLLNPARHSGEIQNRGARTVLLEAGIDVLDTNPAFAVTHEKSMVVDDATAFIGSLNWDPDNFEETREFAVISTDPDEVAEVIDCFEADWSRQPFEPRRPSNLIWCPGAGREQIARVHRPGETFPVRAERTIPGRDHRRAPGAGETARREGPRHDPAFALAAGQETRGRASETCASCTTSASASTR